MVNTRSQVTDNQHTFMCRTDRHSDTESESSVPEVLTREQMSEFDNGYLLDYSGESERRAVNQRFTEMTRQISELTNLVLALTEKISSNEKPSSSNREGNVPNITTSNESDTRSDRFRLIKSWESPNSSILPEDTGVEFQTFQVLEFRMPERTLRRKTRRDSLTSSVEEPENTSARTEHEQSISDRDLSKISEKVERSVCRMIRETETNQREILKMIENLSSKIDSLSERNSKNMNTGTNDFQSENAASTSRNCETESMTQDEGLYTSKLNLLLETLFKALESKRSRFTGFVIKQI